MDVIGIIGCYDLVSMTRIAVQADPPNDSVPPLPVLSRSSLSVNQSRRAARMRPRLKLLLLSGHTGRTSCWLGPVANAPKWTLVSQAMVSLAWLLAGMHQELTDSI
jgi:hypothetical protein